jgi:hypothetical protein
MSQESLLSVSADPPTSACASVRVLTTDPLTDGTIRTPQELLWYLNETGEIPLGIDPLFPEDGPHWWECFIRDLYSLMHRLEILWTPAPPYNNHLTYYEAEDEFNRIKARLKAEVTNWQPSRVAFDPESQTLVLDGKKFLFENPRAFFLYKAIADKKGEPITRAELRKQIKNLKGDKTIPNLQAKWPTELRATIKRGTCGYWLCLPAK